MKLTNVTIKGAFGYLSQQPDGTIQYRQEVGLWERFDVDVDASQLPQPVTPPSPNPPIQLPALTLESAKQIIQQTAKDYPFLIQEFDNDGDANVACIELLRRCIYRLSKAGYSASRQRNPSGAISNDKLCLTLGHGWIAIDIMSIGYAHHATTMNWTEVTPANPVPDTGIPG